jgi:beta-phosphoglucomutase
MKNKLAIFDLDGTLFDTTECNYRSYKQALSENKFALERDYYAEKCHSRNYKTFLPSIIGSSIAHREKIHGRKTELYPSFLGMATENTHLFNIIETIRATYHTAIATTASRANTVDILRHFGRLELFDLLVCGEDVVNPKPDPGCFLKAMEHFGIHSINTVIFEDSEIGIQSALATGASVMVIHYF